MASITPVDVNRFTFAIGRDLTVAAAESPPGPPRRIDGMTAGIVTMSRDPPHGGEMHPDGDEVLYVISGRVEVTGDSTPEPLHLGAGDACIVPKGEWHRVHVVEPVTLLHITPGPNHEHRPPAAARPSREAGK